MSITQMQMQSALKQFGIERDHENIEKTIMNECVIDSLIELYNENPYQLQTENVVKFLHEMNDIEMNGIDENFVDFE